MNNISLRGKVAQSVEQRIENPCVGGSIPSLPTTIKEPGSPPVIPGFFLLLSMQALPLAHSAGFSRSGTKVFFKVLFVCTGIQFR